MYSVYTNASVALCSNFFLSLVRSTYTSVRVNDVPLLSAVVLKVRLGTICIKRMGFIKAGSQQRKFRKDVTLREVLLS